MNKTEEVIERLDKYLSLMRFNYTTQEKLVRLKILSDYYSVMEETPTKENFKVTIECAEQLSGAMTLPLKVRGVFLKEGRPQKKYYTAEALRKAGNNPVNMKFPIMLDHRDKEAGKIVGGVDKISYDQTLGGLRWWGHINNETFARNIMDGLITDVSVTVFSASQYSDVHGMLGVDLTFGELSLVMKGAADGNFIQIDEGDGNW